jgi:flagellar biogenesis protein FliO
MLAALLCVSVKAVDTAAPTPASANINTAIRADSSDKGFSGPYENKPIHRTDRTTPTNPSTTSNGYTTWDFGRVPLALGAVLLLIFSLRWMIRSLGGYQTGKAANRAVQVLTRTTISPRQQMIVVQFGRRLLLVGSAGSELKSLCQIDEPDEVAEVLAQIRQGSGTLTTRSFGTMFGRAEKAYEGGEPSSSAADVTSEAVDETELDPTPRELTGQPVRSEAIVGLMDRIRRISEQFQG